MSIAIEKVRDIEDGEVLIYRATLKSGVSIAIMNWGATLVEVNVPDENGLIENIVLGYKDLSRYIENPFYMGATVGRTAGRIGNAVWNKSTSGKEASLVRLTANSGKHHIHGGHKGFSHKLWDAVTLDSFEEAENLQSAVIKLATSSSSGEEGYPGNLKVEVTYQIYEDGKLEISYDALSDDDTLVNLTNHAYFNLNGHGEVSIEQHTLALDSDKFICLNDAFVPTGDVENVEDTPFDFRLSTAIGDRMAMQHPQLIITGGFDHPWLLNEPKQQIPQAVLEGSVGRRRMSVWTNQPCVVVYTMNFDSEELMSTGNRATARNAVCLEFQNPPIAEDGSFTEYSIVLKGIPYRRYMVFKFEAGNEL